MICGNFRKDCIHCDRKRNKCDFKEGCIYKKKEAYLDPDILNELKRGLKKMLKGGSNE